MKDATPHSRTKIEGHNNLSRAGSSVLNQSSMSATKARLLFEDPGAALNMSDMQWNEMV